MWSISGIFVLPKDPKFKKVATQHGSYFNFQAVTQGRGDVPQFQYWSCSMWVPEKDIQKWEPLMTSGNVFLVEHGYATSIPVQDGKYHNTNIKLDFNKTRHLQTPVWSKE